MGAHHSRRRSSLGTTVVMVLFVGARLAADLHKSAVVHVVCPEHGRTMHAPRASLFAAEPPAGVAAGSGRHGREHEDHEHCSLFFAERYVSIAPVPVALAEPLTFVASTAPAPTRPVGPVILRVAPKGSPPAPLS